MLTRSNNHLGRGPRRLYEYKHDWKVGYRGFKPRSGIQVSKNQNVSSALTRKDLILWGSICDREVACSTSAHRGSNFESCVLRAVSSHEVLPAQFSLYVHEVAYNPIHFIFINHLSAILTLSQAGHYCRF